MAFLPLVEHVAFLLASSEEENAVVGVAFKQQLDHALHLLGRVHLALMCCKRRYAYPSLALGFGVDALRNKTHVATLWWEDAVKL